MEKLRVNTKDLLPNLFILENQVHHLEEENVLIAGCTLWTHVPDDAVDVVQDGMNDYYRISTMKGISKEISNSACNNVRRLHVYHTNEFHEESMKFLNIASDLAKTKSVNKFIILTHHAPLTSGTSCPEYEIPGRKLNHGFSTDLSEWIKSNDIDAWIFGHTHWNCDFELENTRIVANQYGYRGIDNQENLYKNDKVLEFALV